MSEGSCGDETVLDWHRPSDRTQMRQQLGPARPRLGVPRHAVNVRDCLVKPMLEIAAPLSKRKQKDTEAHLPENHRIDHQVALVAPQPLDHPWIRVRPDRLAQQIGVAQSPHDCDPSVSADSDSIGANQPFTGQASSMSTKPWLSGLAATRRYSPRCTRSISNAWPGSILSCLRNSAGMVICPFDEITAFMLRKTMPYLETAKSLRQLCRAAGSPVWGEQPGQFSGRQTAPDDRFPSSLRSQTVGRRSMMLQA